MASTGPPDQPDLLPSALRRAPASASIVSGECSGKLLCMAPTRASCAENTLFGPVVTPDRQKYARHLWAAGRWLADGAY
ncbi:hypothetical protein VTH06DRAFT_1458 [Thermothelomyces fergusii]